MAEVIPIGDARAEPDAGRCHAVTAKGDRCRNRAVEGNRFCRTHAATHDHPEGPAAEDGLRKALEFVRRRVTGDYDVDDFGFDHHLTEELLAPIARLLHEKWWRTEWIGVENVPAEGSALLVSNHAGTLPWDAVMMKFGVLDRAGRHVRLLAADLAFRLPFVGPMARQSGNTLACEEDALRLLERGDLLGVFPEGYKGLGKPFRERYKLQRFGRGGFIELALRARCPIVPVSIVGSEEIYPMLHNAKTVARIGGFPYFPVTPFFPWLGPLGLIPLPSKWIVEFGEPIPTDDVGEDAWEDPLTVFDMMDRVREVIQQTLYRNLTARRSVWY
jgi:1-acyl-sn-glycerol-3-phosphate acyltransferase